MSKKTNTNLVLTQQDLNEEGIRTQLTQNDLLEVLVTERLEVIDARFNALEKEHQEIITLINVSYTAVREKSEKEALKTLKKAGFSISLEDIKFSYYPSLVELDHYYIINHVGKHSYKSVDRMDLCTSTHLVYPTNGKFKGTLRITVNKETAGINSYHEYKVPVDFTYKYNSDVILQRIKDYNEKVDVFIEEMKGVNINYNTVLKEMRVKFNKELIKAGSPKLRAKILEGFGLSI